MIADESPEAAPASARTPTTSKGVPAMVTRRPTAATGSADSPSSCLSRPSVSTTTREADSPSAASRSLPAASLAEAASNQSGEMPSTPMSFTASVPHVAEVVVETEPERISKPGTAARRAATSASVSPRASAPA